MIGWMIVLPARGTLKTFFLASSAAFCMARRDFLGLAVAEADAAVAVADDHEGGEGEAPTTLDDLGHPAGPADRALLELAATAAAVVATAAVAAALVAALRGHRPPGRRPGTALSLLL